MKFSILFYGDETTTTKKSIGGNGELPKKNKKKTRENKAKEENENTREIMMAVVKWLCDLWHGDEKDGRIIVRLKIMVFILL